MRIALIGADFEENLALGILASAVEARGHHATIHPFNDPSETAALARAIVGEAPEVVGLSIQFQHRAHEFLALARAIRSAGFGGHLTAGGEFATLAHREVLSRNAGIDSIVLHEGEETLPELLDALQRRSDLGSVRGLARMSGGDPIAPERRGLIEDLDQVPFARRYRPHARHAGVPFIPILGSRGCWGSCSYCSITSFYREAKAAGGGKMLRLRSPENVAAEMALLWHAAGGDGIFCFHDDNFLLPRAEDTLERLRAMRRALDGFGVGRIGLIGKCRPETLTTALALELRKLGVLRLYVGVENASQAGAGHLARGRQHQAIDAALAACTQAGIFACYNLLIFEPDATLDDVRTNIAFIRRQAEHPVNFCRAEPYHGTPLMQSLAARGGLGGSYLGWDYRIADDRTELLFRIAAAAFRERNFAADGVANRSMGLGYIARILEHAARGPDLRVSRARDQAEALTSRIVLDTARYLERAVELAAGADLRAHDAIERATALLGLEIARADAGWHAEMDVLYEQMEAIQKSAPPLQRPPRPTPRMLQIAQAMAFGASLALWASGCNGCTATVVDPLPADAGFRDGTVVDPPPPDAAIDGGSDAGARDGLVADPAPLDAAMDAGPVVDPPPPDAGLDSGMIDYGPVVDPAPGDASVEVGAVTPQLRLPVIDHWRDSTPRRAGRSQDLALAAAPEVRLESSADGAGRIFVRLIGEGALSLRWEAGGSIEGADREIVWLPASSEDHLVVAVRGQHGVAVLSLRARNV